MKSIFSILFGVIFLISSSGYVMYKSNCLCSGQEQTSVFLQPDSCEDDFHKHSTHNPENKQIACSEHVCHECTSHTKACGCESPEVFFFKLKDHLLDEEVRFISVKTVQLFVESTEIINPQKITEAEEEQLCFYTDPPPKVASSFDFLIQIQKLKIPELA